VPAPPRRVTPLSTPGTALARTARATLPGSMRGPELPLLAWRGMQPDCIPRQAHRSLIPHLGAQ